MRAEDNDGFDPWILGIALSSLRGCVPQKVLADAVNCLLLRDDLTSDHDVPLGCRGDAFVSSLALPPATEASIVRLHREVRAPWRRQAR